MSLPDLTCPMSSFQCWARQVPASTVWRMWEAGKEYSVGNHVIPTSENGYYYVCVSSDGPSGENEPVWPYWINYRDIPRYYLPWYSRRFVNDGGVRWFLQGVTGILSRISLSVVIPDISLAPEIAVRSSYWMNVFQNFHFTNDSIQSHRLLVVKLERIRLDQGAKSGAITLYGTRMDRNWPEGKHVDLTGRSYGCYDGGKLRYRCQVNPFLQVGDTAVISGNPAFMVTGINYIISPRQQIMEVSSG